MQETKVSKEEYELIIQRGAEQLADIIEQWIWYREGQKKSLASMPSSHSESQKKEPACDAHIPDHNRSNVQERKRCSQGQLF